MAIPGIKRTPPSVETIYKIVAKHYGYNIDNIKNSELRRDIALMRHTAMYFARKLTSDSYQAIGKQIGKKDHTTCVYAVRKVENLMSVDRKFNQDIRLIEQKIRREFL